jgi:tetratricopeptide (TPR) repeat protein
MAAAIAREINVQLTPGEQSRLASVRSVSPEGHDAYLRARYFFNRPSDENLQKAIAQFEQSIKLDPGYAPAYSGLSDASLWAGYNEGFTTSSQQKPKARAAAEKAVELDPNSAEAHTSVAVFKLFYDKDWVGCEQEFRKAFALNSNYAFAHDQFGVGLALQGRHAEAKAEGRRAMELDPLSPQVLLDATMAYMFSGDYKTARDLGRKAEALDPTYFFGVMLEGWVDFQEGRYKEAIPFFEKAKGLGAPPFVSAFLSFAHGMSGDRKAALAELDALKKLSGRAGVLPFNMALVHLGLGERELSIDNLERALAADSQTLPWIGQDRMFDSLRAEPRFKALLKKIRL